jgi:hypothetical protein
MEKLSKNQLLFTLIAVVLTFTFLYTLSHFITNQIWNGIYIIAIGFGLLMFLNGLINGYFDDERKQRIDISFRYHFITYISINSVHFIYLFFDDTNFKLLDAILGAIAWGIGLLAHFLYSRKTIKGYTAEELFE